MTRQMTATQLKAAILGVLDEVAEGEEFEITKHGRTIARLVPAVGANALRGSMVGVAVSAAEESELYTTGAEWDLP
jgi:prevent-host-death family protein